MRVVLILLAFLTLTACGYSKLGDNIYLSEQSLPALKVPSDLKKTTKQEPLYVIPRGGLDHAMATGESEELLWPPTMKPSNADS